MQDNDDDDYVARLLARDAEKLQQEYSRRGASAYLTGHRAARRPVLDQRYLANIMRPSAAQNRRIQRDQRERRRQHVSVGSPRHTSHHNRRSGQSRDIYHDDRAGRLTPPRSLRRSSSPSHDRKTVRSPKPEHEQSSREWDRGKHIADDGSIDIKPAWA